MDTISGEIKLDLELLPPKPRYKCEGDCNKSYKHLEICCDGKRRCSKCKKKMVTNKFYTPLIERKRFDVISKFNITNAEKNVLINCNHKSLNQVERDLCYLKNLKKRKSFERKQLMQEDKNKIDLNKKLVEGLKGK